MDFTPPFGQWLKQRRRALGLRQEDLAQRAGYATITIRKIESGEMSPSRELAEQLAECLKVSVADRAAFLAFARGMEGRPRPNNLPSPSTSLVGRDADGAQLCELLRWPGTRLVTVIGPPGVGKTRLAIIVAREMEAAYADGTCFVALAPVDQAEQVAPAVAQALGLSNAGPVTAADAVAYYLRGRRLLLVLDNCEQVLDGVGLLVAGWLETAPELTVLATSRAALRLTIEQVYDLAPLALPDAHSATSISPAALTACPAVDLFVQRASAAKLGFHLTAANAPAVAEICRWLDGLPLAIELAAMRTRMFTPQSLLQHLDQHQGAALRLLTQGAHDLPARQRTLRAAIDWSYHLLDAEGQSLFRHLGMFVGGCTLDAIQALVDDSSPISNPQSPISQSLISNLQSLIDHSLVQQEEGMDGGTRYTMLETIREYALEQLQACGEMEAARNRHLDYFTRLTEPGTELLEPDASDRDWKLRLEAEYGNLRGAALWSQSDGVDPLIALRLAVAITPLWASGYEGLSWTGEVAEMRGWVERALSRCADPPPRLRGWAIHSIGWLRLVEGDLVGAHEMMCELLRLKRKQGDKRDLVFALFGVSVTAFHQGKNDLVQTYMEEHLALSREIGLRAAIGASLGLLGGIALERQEYVHAISLMDEALQIARELGIRWTMSQTGSLSRTLKPLGVARMLAGDVRGGIAHLEEALELARERGDWLDASYALVFLGHAALITGNPARARKLHRESLAIGRGKDYLHGVALAELALIALDCGDRRAHAVLAGAAERQVTVHPQEILRVFNLCSTFDSILAEAHARLDDPALAAAFAEGRAMTWEQAMAYALADPRGDGLHPAGGDPACRA